MDNLIKYFFRIAARMLSVLFYIMPIRKMDIIKSMILRLHGCHIGKNNSFSPGLFILRGENVEIGNGCNIGIDCRLMDFGLIRIGNNSLISHNVTIISGDHSLDIILSGTVGDVHIGNDVWLGASVTIVGPVKIGDGAVIGANSFVKENIPAGKVYAGSPAKEISNKVAFC